MCGGLAEERQMDESVKTIVINLQSKIEQKLGRKLETLEPVSYRSQVVAGTNYFVKCHTGQDQYLHLRIFVPLPCNSKEPELHAIHPEIKSLKDPIEYFESK